MSDAPKKPEPRMEFRPVSRVGRAALERLYGREKAERLWRRGPVDEDNLVPVVMPDGHEPMENDDDQGRTGA